MNSKTILEELLASVKDYNAATLKYIQHGISTDPTLIAATEKISFAIKAADDFFETEYREPDILPPLETYVDEESSRDPIYRGSVDDWI